MNGNALVPDRRDTGKRGLRGVDGIYGRDIFEFSHWRQIFQILHFIRTKFFDAYDESSYATTVRESDEKINTPGYR